LSLPNYGAQMDGRPGQDDQLIVETHTLDLRPEGPTGRIQREGFNRRLRIGRGLLEGTQ